MTDTSSGSAGGSVPEISVVMPCLNEQDTLANCIRKAQGAIQAAGITVEVIVADNGSTDDSLKIAAGLGARVVPVSARGYGSALMGGVAAARGRFIIMGDADESYGLRRDPGVRSQVARGIRSGPGMPFVLRGRRDPAGCHAVLPPLDREPHFSWMVRHWFGVPIHDIYCGLRGFTQGLYDRLDLRCTGMEFATEMVIKAGLRKARVAEIPITLHPNGRKSHAPHLKTVRDGWRTLRYFLVCSPRWLFIIPRMLLILFGLAGYALALPCVKIRGIAFDAHTLLFATVSILCGWRWGWSCSSRGTRSWPAPWCSGGGRTLGIWTTPGP